ncbi:hypothetical protein JWG44_16425 [Leptospira sp. 201903071]|uniref:hypothetical protein n=1 Tax=Leptospira ainazelensis TaxID=2810034 RepID=UPI0019663B9D|nr:hypothetical protein [Leptospira ainazelensis]MBM9501842.1 hypothetical protein [Leptospira ainazelensis]
MQFFRLSNVATVLFFIFFQGCLGDRGEQSLSFKGIFGFPITSVVGPGPFSVSGSISGLTGTGLRLQLNGGETLDVLLSGDFKFQTLLENQKTYLVTVLANPTGPNQTCSVVNGSGLIAARDVSDVRVVCSSSSYTVSGSVTGLSGSGLTLFNNGTDLIGVSGASFIFPTSIASGGAYSVSVSTQPSSPTQVCSVSNGTGTIVSANITNVLVTCSTSSFSVGGGISGLLGTGLKLRNNGGDEIAPSGTSFVFPTSVASGAAYTVSVSAQPTAPAQTCSISNGSGSISSSNVTNVAINCSTNSYTVGGSVTGLTGSGLKLTNNGGDEITVSGSTFVFPTSLADGSTYAVAVSSQPTSPLQLCSVSSGSGTIGGTHVSSPSIVCINQYSVGGSVTGLSGTLTLRNSVNSDTLNINSNGTFTMPLGLAASETFHLEVTSSPAGQFCKIAMMYGTIVSSHITDVRIHCQTGTSGVISGGNSVFKDLSFLTGNMEVLTGGIIFAGQLATNGHANGIGNASIFDDPSHITTDGKNIFVADYMNGKVRAIEISTRNVSDLFTFSKVRGVATDGVYVYACGENSSTIVKYDLGTGIQTAIVPANVSGFLDGPIAGARFNKPNHLSVDGVKVYVSDTTNHRIRRIDQRTGSVSTIAGTGLAGIGNGSATATRLNAPKGLYLQGNTLFIASTNADAIVKLDLSLSTLSVIAGGTTGSYDAPTGIGAAFSAPTGLISDGQRLYVTEGGSGLIRTIDLTSPHPTETISGCIGKIGTTSGVRYSAPPCPGSATTAASFVTPYGITSDGINIFISDDTDHIIRKME